MSALLHQIFSMKPCEKLGFGWYSYIPEAVIKNRDKKAPKTDPPEFHLASFDIGSSNGKSYQTCNNLLDRPMQSIHKGDSTEI